MPKTLSAKTLKLVPAINCNLKVWGMHITRERYSVGRVKESSILAVLCQFIEPGLRLHVVRFIFALHKKEYRIGRMFRYT